MGQSELSDYQSSDPERPWRDEQTLRELYYGEQLPIGEVAGSLGCAVATIQRWMARHEIETRANGELQHIKSHENPATFYTRERDGYEVWHSSNRDNSSKMKVHRLLAVAEYGFDAVCDMVVHHGKTGGELPPVEIPWANWDENIELMTLEEHMSHHHRIGSDILVGDLKDFAEEIAHTPTIKEMEENGPYGASVYEKRFGSWNEALQQAGLTPNVPIPKADLVDELKRLSEELDRPLKTSDMDEHGLYHKATYYRNFGSWGAALEAAGIDS